MYCFLISWKDIEIIVRKEIVNALERQEYSACENIRANSDIITISGRGDI